MRVPEYRLLFATFRSIAKKELYHILRDPSVFSLALVFPLIEFFLLGYVLDINVKRVNTVVYDLSNTQESRRLIERFINTDVFHIVEWVNSDGQLRQAIVSGKAKVGIKIPVDYSQHLLSQQPTSVLILVDGSNATVTNTVVNVSTSITLQESLKTILSDSDKTDTPIKVRPSVLFNPSTRSANFFLPGLIVYELPSITILLLACAIAGERERGTMDQLNVAPYSLPGFILGKAVPYGILAFIQLVELILMTRYMFQVPINGSVVLLLVFSIPFLLCDLGLGIIVSAKANTVMEAGQFGSLFRSLPLYFSGYIFSLESAHPFFQFLSNFVPHRYFMDIVRGVFLRGAGIKELWFSVVILCLMSIVIFLLGVRAYRKLT
ncbi:MAG: hypothetical protein FD167_9 [bacterium]|nr:MAG: hypothetical protein FD167_9 [bacterium]